jgi:hypothetical protein
MARIYVASSWRNQYYEDAIFQLQQAGHDIWNWRKPPTGGNGFSWRQVGNPDYQHGDKVSHRDMLKMLTHPIAQSGFASDLMGMHWCEIGVLLRPSGCSAHLEAGWLAGAGKRCFVVLPEDTEPDLMLMLMTGGALSSVGELIRALKHLHIV